MTNSVALRESQILPRLNNVGGRMPLPESAAGSPISAAKAITPVKDGTLGLPPNLQEKKHSQVQAFYRQTTQLTAPPVESGQNPLNSPALVATFTTQQLAQQEGLVELVPVNTLAQEQGSMAYRRAGAEPTLYPSTPKLFQADI
ncbi:hypothetical protein ACTL6U_16920 [Rhodovibrionaceae bacterium A322]